MPLLQLHLQQSVCRLSSAVMPPFAIGMMWSISSSRCGSCSKDTPHFLQAKLSRSLIDLYGLAKLAEFPALSSSNTRQVTIQGKLKSTLTVEEAENGTDSEADSSEASSADSSAEGTDTKEYNWYLSGDVDVTKEAYLTALRTEIDSIAFSRLYDFQPSAKALKRCGLSDPAAALTVEYLDSEEERQTVTLLLGASYTDEAGTEYRYAMLQGSEDEVYLVTADSVRQTLAAAEHGYAQASADYNDEASESTQTTE